MLTGMYLFEPEAGHNYSLEEHHLALISRTLGKIPKEIYLKGEYSNMYLNLVKFFLNLNLKKK